MDRCLSSIPAGLNWLTIFLIFVGRTDVSANAFLKKTRQLLKSLKGNTKRLSYQMITLTILVNEVGKLLGTNRPPFW